MLLLRDLDQLGIRTCRDEKATERAVGLDHAWPLRISHVIEMAGRYWIGLRHDVAGLRFKPSYLCIAQVG